jgi:hypothetical protein
MAAINFEDYLSTSVRWAMFKADWPDASIEFSESTPSDIGIPSTFSKKDEKICVAHVARYKGDESPIVAYKAESDVRGPKDTDSWHALCSKAMGRAMKKAGYPDTMTDLKILMKFREAKTGVKKVEQVQVSNVAPIETKTLIAGQQVESKVPAIESKESPAKESVKPLLEGWKNEGELEDAHRTFKTMCADLSPDELESLREHHDKLNGRKWPMEKGDINNLMITLQGIRAAREEADADSMLTSAPLKAAFELLSQHAQKEVTLAFGDPSKWEENMPEREYNAIMDLFEAASQED